MATDKSSTSPRRWAVLLGLAASLAVAAAHWGGSGARLELQTLDTRFRRLGNAPRADYVLHVDIDDRSLETIGRWPWPRGRLAGVLETLLDAGARAVALDIILPNPQKVRYVSDAAEIYSDDPGQLLGGAGPLPVFDDERLAAALGKAADRVFLPMFVRLEEPNADPIAADLDTRLTTRPALSSRQARRELTAGAASEARRAAAGADTFVQAYLQARALRALRPLGMPADRAGAYPLISGQIVPPLVTFVNAIHRTGFVTVKPDGDGVVRRIPLLARGGDRVYLQFALALAADTLARDRGGAVAVRADAGSVTLDFADGTHRSIPVDRQGFLRINWVPRAHGDVSADRIPIAAAAGIWKLRQERRRLQSLWRVRHLRLAQIVYPPDAQGGRHPLYDLIADADRLHQRRIAYRRDRMRAALFDPADVPKAARDFRKAEEQLEKRIEEKCVELRKDLADADSLQFALEGRPDADARTRQVADELKAIARIAGDDQRINRQIAGETARLRQVAADKVCLIGSTATGAADFVPTPIHERTPGVRVHANILNTITSGAFIRQAWPVVELLVILLAGGAVTLLAAWRNALQAGAGTLLLGAGYVAFNAWVVFALWGVWLTLVAPLVAMVAGFLVVTAYRQLTEERAKRHIRRLFSHAMSSALVDRLLDDPSLAKLGGERRVLSCFFSDLAGFTSLSERLGEQQTVRLLNRYFDHMTDVIQNRHGGYLNKFLGDGILTLFGAPVALTDHAARAVRAAVDCHRELERFNAHLAAEGGVGPAALACRIGVATGEVMVGNCGSTDRMDYTAIGDTVNLASRLESANKFFHTRTLVDGETWRRAEVGDEILARPMGKIVVVGKTEPVPIISPVAYRHETDEPQLRLAEDFARGVDLFSRRDFPAAARLFEALLADHPRDRPTEVYLELSRRHLADPPPEHWQGELVLEEK